MLVLTQKHQEGDPLGGETAPDKKKIELLEDRVARAIAAIDAIRRGLDMYSFLSTDPQERALLMSTLRSAEAAHIKWTRLGGGSTGLSEARAIEQVMNYAFTMQRIDKDDFAASVWGMSLRKESPSREFASAAAQVRNSLVSHSPRLSALGVDTIERALRDWNPGPPRRGGPRKGTRSNARIVKELMVEAGLMKDGTTASSSSRMLRRARQKN